MCNKGGWALTIWAVGSWVPLQSTSLVVLVASEGGVAVHGDGKGALCTSCILPPFSSILQHQELFVCSRWQLHRPLMRMMRQGLGSPPESPCAHRPWRLHLR